MKDSYGREINYIRISLTDRCNLRCIYCMPEGVELVPREEILREQEILEIAGAAARLGISHVKLTGGEPLVRRCCRSLIREMKQVPGIETVTLTTNGVLLNDEVMEFCNREMGNVVLSIDGRKEVHDRMRPFRKGAGSYDLIVPKFQRLVKARTAPADQAAPASWLTDSNR